MAEEWFVNPGVQTISLSDGKTITVKKRLNTGEKRRAMRRMSHEDADGKLRVDRLDVALHTVTAYLLDWTVCDAGGRPVAIRGLDPSAMGEVLDNLEPERFDEIHAAINRHVEQMDADRAKEKNSQDGERNTSAISPSPVTCAGESSTSVN